MSQHPIAIFVSFSGEGGVERMIINLAGALAARGTAVDLVLAKARGEHLRNLPSQVRVIKLGTRHTFTAVFALARYLKREQPAALLAAKDRAIKTAIVARWLSGQKVRLVGRLGTTVSAALENKSAWRKWIWYAGMRAFYRHVDRIVAVSQGVADDVQRIADLPADRLTAIRNPVITESMTTLAAEPIDHPWLRAGEPPVILGAGRLTEQKDFTTLIRAFATVRKAGHPARLIVLGSGRLLDSLKSLSSELGIAADVDFPGFTNNPYAYMARAAMFVLSSAWEGSPNVLTEAMALGTSVVATDCPSGPREILDGGNIAPLVPVGDATALAQAIMRTLAQRQDPALLRAAVRDYRVEVSAENYLRALSSGYARKG